jgi:hypothetical protein
MFQAIELVRQVIEQYKQTGERVELINNLLLNRRLNRKTVEPKVNDGPPAETILAMPSLSSEKVNENNVLEVIVKDEQPQPTEQYLPSPSENVEQPQPTEQYLPSPSENVEQPQPTEQSLSPLAVKQPPLAVKQLIMDALANRKELSGPALAKITHLNRIELYVKHLRSMRDEGLLKLCGSDTWQLVY